MARTIINFTFSDSTLFELCNEWANRHKFKTNESTATSRMYSKWTKLITPITIFFPPRYKVKISLDSEAVTIEAWIAFIKSETEISSASAYQFIPKEILRKQVNDLLTLLDRENNKIQ